jgi:hydroxymethylglutaryl-CoA reductase (NADPH)
MGMNMATIATTEISNILESETPARLCAISSNMCVDKKANLLNFTLGRGIKVWAEAILTNKSIKEVLKTTPEKFIEVVQRKIYLGSILSGSIGANAHAANVLAALFLATGQDMGHIAEVSSVVTTAEMVGKNVHVAVFLPDLIVGTVGGGTALPTQSEGLSILGLVGGNNGKNSQKFAEILGAAVLAGEISLIASLSENSLAKVHKILARGGK